MPKKPSLAAALNDASKNPSKTHVTKKVESDEILNDENYDEKIPPLGGGRKQLPGILILLFASSLNSLHSKKIKVVRH